MKRYEISVWVGRGGAEREIWREYHDLDAAREAVQCVPGTAEWTTTIDGPELFVANALDGYVTLQAGAADPELPENPFGGELCDARELKALTTAEE